MATHLGKEGTVQVGSNAIAEIITVGPTAGAEYANGMSAGPITIANNITLTIPNNSVYTIV